MTNRLKGKVAIVTGAASGIGAATARMMAAEGARVLVSDINREGAEAVAAEIGKDMAIGIGTDAGDPQQIQAMIQTAIDRFGGLDILHNNAGNMGILSRDLALVDADPAVWNELLRVNLLGPMYSSRYAIPHMIKRGGGSIIHTSSVCGLQASDNLTAYSITKAGLISLAQSIATQYGKQGIRSNCIATGYTLSPYVRSKSQPEQIEVYLDQITTPNYGEPEDQAAVVVFLASDESRFVSGQVIPVDGGMSCHLPTVAGHRHLNPSGARGHVPRE